MQMDKAVRGRIEAIAAEASTAIGEIIAQEFDYVDDPQKEADALRPAVHQAVLDAIERRVTPAFSDVALAKVNALQNRGYDVTSLVLSREGRADRAFVSPFGRVDWLASPVTAGERDALCDAWSDIATPLCIAICPKCGYHNQVSNEWQSLAGDRMGLECEWCTHKSPNAGEPGKVIPDFEVRLFVPHDMARTMQRELLKGMYYSKQAVLHCRECYEEYGEDHAHGCHYGWLESMMNLPIGRVPSEEAEKCVNGSESSAG
jgi:hypothetical protein